MVSPDIKLFHQIVFVCWRPIALSPFCHHDHCILVREANEAVYKRTLFLKGLILNGFKLESVVRIPIKTHSKTDSNRNWS